MTSPLRSNGIEVIRYRLENLWSRSPLRFASGRASETDDTTVTIRTRAKTRIGDRRPPRIRVVIKESIPRIDDERLTRIVRIGRAMDGNVAATDPITAEDVTVLNFARREAPPHSRLWWSPLPARGSCPSSQPSVRRTPAKASVGWANLLGCAGASLHGDSIAHVDRHRLLAELHGPRICLAH
jgi:hypothetical protein